MKSVVEGCLTGLLSFVAGLGSDPQIRTGVWVYRLVQLFYCYAASIRSWYYSILYTETIHFMHILCDKCFVEPLYELKCWQSEGM